MSLVSLFKYPTLFIIVLMLLSSGTIVMATFCPKITENLPGQVACEVSDTRFRLRYGCNYGLTCKSNQTTCLFPGDRLCFKPELKTNLYRRRQRSSTQIIVDLNTVLGNFLSYFKTKPGNIEINVKHMVPLDLTKPIQFDSCEAIFANKTCITCDICANKTSVQLNCFNILLETTDSDPAKRNFTFPAFPCIGF